MEHVKFQSFSPLESNPSVLGELLPSDIPHDTTAKLQLSATRHHRPSSCPLLSQQTPHHPSLPVGNRAVGEIDLKDSTDLFLFEDSKKSDDPEEESDDEESQAESVQSETSFSEYQASVKSKILSPSSEAQCLSCPLVGEMVRVLTSGNET